MKIPHDVDDLMWDIAEKDSPELLDEFVARFPEHRDELVKRLKMLRDLKGARPKKARGPEPFVPAARPRRDPAPSRALAYAFGAGCLVLAGVVFGIVLQRNFLSGQGVAQKVEEPAVTAQREVQNPAAQNPAQQYPPPTANNQQLERQTWIPQQAASRPVAATSFDRKITVEFERAMLSRVLEDVALKGGVRLQAAPGMPDLEIEAKYFDLPVITILNDLGRNFGFTPMKQTDSEALLIPAVDGQNPPSAADGGYAAAVPDRPEGDPAPSAPSRSRTQPGTLPSPSLNGDIGGRR